MGSFPLAALIREVCDAAELSAQQYPCVFRALPVEPGLAVRGTRDLLIAAVANLLQIAFQFAAPRAEVLLTAYAQGDRILIDVKDQCGRMATYNADMNVSPSQRAGATRTGKGLGLTITERTVAAHGGTLTVHDLVGAGCVFTINLPRSEVLT